ncbi:very short patch repair endonuclease [Rhodanobacter denitrificans]|uniref:Very short patch repair endonuclease n=1 Tax=Rhodanobacter denitrificans TaxID=666685 RepID=M4NAM5_9GAMM|nr:very short patch repair endonuclease [Rhodanobacter denitrificans]AGG87595.1 T/G mismatch-specific endonuclease [Rhodanobacter denitrificans]
MDTVSPAIRSRMMSRIRGSDTAPELAVRSCAHRLGLRFRLHVRNLPGRPDLVFPKHRKIIFVHGCFWHRHGCKWTTTPKTRQEFWRQKFLANQSRDRRNIAALEIDGWTVHVIWECETRDMAALEIRLAKLFGLDTLPASVSRQTRPTRRPSGAPRSSR